MDWLVTLSSTYGINLIGEADIVAVNFVRVDAHEGAWYTNLQSAFTLGGSG